MLDQLLEQQKVRKAKIWTEIVHFSLPELWTYKIYFFTQINFKNQKSATQILLQSQQIYFL